MSAPDTCAAYRYVDELCGDDELCGEPAIGDVTAACLHEHLNTKPICSGCSADLQRGGELFGELFCASCDEGPQPHHCPAFVVIDWRDESPRTVVQDPAARCR